MSSEQCAVCIVQNAVCIVQNAVCIVQCALCSVHCAVCIVQCAASEGFGRRVTMMMYNGMGGDKWGLTEGRPQSVPF